MLLSDRIAADIRKDLASGKHLGQDCTLHALAKRFGVSLTPVRAALAQLVASGHLVKLPNGRLATAKNPPQEQGLSEPDHPPKSAEERIRAEVMNTGLTCDQPPFLREEDAAARFNIGRTVLRRLFFLMAGEGLLEHVPRRGWRARPISETDLRDFVAVRELLETKALMLAWDGLDRGFLEHVREGNQPARGPVAAKVDNRLHAHWIERCGNRYIAAFFAQNGGAHASLFDYASLDRPTASAMALQHRAILDAVLSGDRQEACRQVADHARAQAENARRLRLRLLHTNGD